MSDSSEPTAQSVTILIVDDDSVDVENIQRGLRRQRISNPVIHAVDGVQAWEILEGSSGVSKVKKPFIVLLDLNMPRMDGMGFLAKLRASEDFQETVVFVLTTSASDEDKTEAYGYNIAGYVVKQRAGEQFMDLVSMLDHYWRIVELPT